MSTGGRRGRSRTGSGSWVSLGFNRRRGNAQEYLREAVPSGAGRYVERRVAVEVAEAVLAHAVWSPIEAAHRADLFVRRRRLMEGWADYSASGPSK